MGQKCDDKGQKCHMWTLIDFDWMFETFIKLICHIKEIVCCFVQDDSHNYDVYRCRCDVGLRRSCVHGVTLVLLNVL